MSGSGPINMLCKLHLTIIHRRCSNSKQSTHFNYFKWAGKIFSLLQCSWKHYSAALWCSLDFEYAATGRNVRTEEALVCVASEINKIDFNKESIHIYCYDFSLFYITFEGNLCAKGTLFSYKISFMATSRSTEEGSISQGNQMNIISAPLELI